MSQAIILGTSSFASRLFRSAESPTRFIPPLYPTMKRILAISNQKGGVGKTTTAINLASALSLLEQKILLIDMDPQGNASAGLGIHKSTVSKGIASILLRQSTIAEVIQPYPNLPNLDIIPSCLNLNV